MAFDPRALISYAKSIDASAKLRIGPEKRARLADVLEETIRARGRGSEEMLKGEIMPDKAVLSEEDEAEAYARRSWELLEESERWA